MGLECNFATRRLLLYAGRWGHDVRLPGRTSPQGPRVWAWGGSVRLSLCPAWWFLGLHLWRWSWAVGIGPIMLQVAR